MWFSDTGWKITLWKEGNNVAGQKKIFSLQNVVFGLQKKRSSPPTFFNVYLHMYLYADIIWISVIFV